MLLRVEFKIIGKVQKVYFRKSAKQEALKYGVVGWIQNNMEDGSVQGIIEGSQESIKEMCYWLSKVCFDLLL
jgi:acylphosphatase